MYLNRILPNINFFVPTEIECYPDTDKCRICGENGRSVELLMGEAQTVAILMYLANIGSCVIDAEEINGCAANNGVNVYYCDEGKRSALKILESGCVWDIDCSFSSIDN